MCSHEPKESETAVRVSLVRVQLGEPKESRSKDLLSLIHDDSLDIGLGMHSLMYSLKAYGNIADKY